jgi:8-oxo-dGTP pyrophosphatase MutT (NUDIX family)
MKFIQTFESYQSAGNGNMYWGSLGSGILPVCPATGRILVGFRSRHVLEPHTWGTFGGKLDIDEGVDETIKVAAMRELEEETAFTGHMDLVDAFIFRDGSFSYHNFFGVVEEEFTPTLNWENEDAVWYTLEELLELKGKHFGLASLLKNSLPVLEKILGVPAV